MKTTQKIKKTPGEGFEINNAAIKKIVDFLFEGVNSRAKEVLILRFGMDGKKPRALSAIGNKFRITRERVRQIEVDSFKRMKKMKKPVGYKEIIDRAIEIIDFYGDFCEKRKLKEKIKVDISDLERRYLMIILNSSSRLRFQKTNKQLKAYWYQEKEKSIKKMPSLICQFFPFFMYKL